MDNNIDYKKAFRELQFRCNDLSLQLESDLEIAVDENECKDKQLAELRNIIQELRHIRDDSVDEYIRLHINYETVQEELANIKVINESLTKRLQSTNDDLDSLYKKYELANDKVEQIKTDNCQLMVKLAKRDEQLQDMEVLKQSTNELLKELAKEKEKNSKLKDEIKRIREECLKKNELNVSVDEFNAFSFNGSCVGETMDCVVDIKLKEIERNLEEKNKELNEEKQKLVNIDIQLQEILSLKDELNQLSTNNNNRLNNDLTKENEKSVKLETNLNEMNTVLEETDSKLAVVVFENEKLKSKLSESMTMNEELNKKVDSIAKELDEEKQKTFQTNKEMEELHRKYLQVVDRNKNSINQYEKVVSDLKTRLNTEEMSFDFERKTKERYLKENENYMKENDKYCRQIGFLENENQRLRETIDSYNKSMIATSASTSNVYSMPTTVHIHTNPNSSTNLSIHSMDITNPNNSSVSLTHTAVQSHTNPKRLKTDLKHGECLVNESVLDDQRLAILQKRNTMVAPHLKSSYGVELAFMSNNSIGAEDIKHGFRVNQSNNALKEIQNISYRQNNVSINQWKDNSNRSDNVSAIDFNKSIANKRR